MVKDFKRNPLFHLSVALVILSIVFIFNIVTAIVLIVTAFITFLLSIIFDEDTYNEINDML